MVTRILKKGVFVLLIFIMIFSSSCKGGGIKTVDSSTYQPELPEPFDMGSVHFEVDPTHTASLDYMVNANEEQILQVIDSSGITWTLTLPIGALNNDLTLTMTALSQMTSTDIPGELIGGVLLEPDGLIFVNPPTITLSGTGEESVILFFTGKQDGTGNEFAVTKLGDFQVGATIFHFSTFWGDEVSKAKASGDSAWATYAGKMGQELNELIAMIKALLKGNLKIPLPPPAVEFGCKEDQGTKDDSQKMDAYIEQFIQPEAYFISALLGKAQFQGAVSGHWEWNKYTGKMDWITDYDSRIMELIKQLTERIASKLDLLLKTSGKDPKYFPVIAQVIVRINKLVELVGGDATPFTKYYSELAKMIDKVYETLLDKIVSGHDYSAAMDIIGIYRKAQLLGLSTEKDVLGRLDKALTFNMIGNYSWHSVESHWELKTEFKVYHSWADAAMTGSGSGTITYINDIDPGDIVRDPGGFYVDATIKNFDFCNQTATVLVTPYAAEMDVFTIKGNDNKLTQPYSMVCWTAGFKDKTAKDKAGNVMGNLYAFPVNFFNKDASPVNQGFDAKPPAGAKLVGTFTVTLEHTPQK